MQLTEQYRPRTFDEVVGQSEAIEQVQHVLRRGWGGRSWWIAGPSGVGKSSLARIIASIGADDMHIEELDAARLTPTRLRDIEVHEMAYRAMGDKQGKVFLVNEAHGISQAAKLELLVILERLPAHVVFIFTTTAEQQGSLFADDSALLSRCTEVTLSASLETRRQMARRAKAIAMAEGIDGLSDNTYDRAIDSYRGNMRMLLANIESGRFAKDAKARFLLEKELYDLNALNVGAWGKAEKAAHIARRDQITALLAV